MSPEYRAYMKPDDIEIKAVTVSPTNAIYGLGSDNNVYVWSKTEGTWSLNIDTHEQL